jgi:hypothetical protein
MATRIAAVRPVASTATLGRLILFNLSVYKGPALAIPGLVFAEQGIPAQLLACQVLTGL